MRSNFHIKPIFLAASLWVSPALAQNCMMGTGVVGEIDGAGHPCLGPRLYFLRQQAEICTRHDANKLSNYGYNYAAQTHAWDKGWEVCDTVAIEYAMELDRTDHTKMDELRKETPP